MAVQLSSLVFTFSKTIQDRTVSMKYQWIMLNIWENVYYSISIVYVIKKYT